MNFQFGLSGVESRHATGFIPALRKCGAIAAKRYMALLTYRGGGATVMRGITDLSAFRKAHDKNRPSPSRISDLPESNSLFPAPAFAARHGDKQGMAATLAEGTARKLVTRKCGRTMTKSEDRGDSRKDGMALI